MSSKETENNYEYDLPGNPFHGAKGSLAENFFKEPISTDNDIQPFNPDQISTMKLYRPWIIGIILMFIFGGIFEFGILGKDGKKGPLCHTIFSDKICSVLAGPVPQVKK